jgi:hypothetical protein
MMIVLYWVLGILGVLSLVSLIFAIIWPERWAAIGEGFCECFGAVCEGDWGGGDGGGSCGGDGGGGGSD